MLIRSLWRSPALRAAAAMGASGLALAAGNLLLARALPADEFARFTLVFAIAMIGISVGPIGADVTLARRRFIPDDRLHLQVCLTSAAVGCALSVGAGLLYPLPSSLLGALFVLIVCGGVMTVAVAHYRSHERFGTALILTMSINASVLVAAVVALAVGAVTALLPAAWMAGCLLLIAILGWRGVRSAVDPANPGEAYSWSEGASAVSFAAAGMILAALDRLVIPNLLGLTALATYSVLATVAGSPFQMLHLGVGYTLLPALRNAQGREHRLRVFRHEAAVILGASVAGAVGVFLLTPLVLQWILSGRYQIGVQLLTAAIFSGLLKVVGSLLAAVVNALGTGRHLVQLSMIGWVAIACSFGGAIVGVRWGLPGLIYGVSAGWLFRAVGIGVLAVPHLRAKEG